MVDLGGRSIVLRPYFNGYKMRIRTPKGSSTNGYEKQP